MRLPLLCFLVLLPVAFAEAPAADNRVTVDRLFREALVHGQAYQQLGELVAGYPSRLGGTDVLREAYDWAERQLGRMQLDRVYRQDVMIPHWERGPAESVALLAPGSDPVPLAALALGFSGATPDAGLAAGVVEVQSLEQLAAIGRAGVAGRIVFFNRPMDPSGYRPNAAYGPAAQLRMNGPAAAAQLGAVAALVRSITFRHDDVPHTGMTRFPAGAAPIPAAALSVLAAERLSAALVHDPAVQVRLFLQPRSLPDAPSCNLIGEIRGRECPDQIIVVGGHLDSWDNTPGAHDDGAGVVQSIEVLRLFRALGLQPRHTIRCVLFTSEENSANGGRAYAAIAAAAGEQHLFAVESDAGGFAPAGFRFASAGQDAQDRAARWRPWFENWGVWSFRGGSVGADIASLVGPRTVAADLTPESQRYFDYHHAATDTMDAVNERELHLGAGALAALVWLVDQEGL